MRNPPHFRAGERDVVFLSMAVSPTRSSLDGSRRYSSRFVAVRETQARRLAGHPSLTTLVTFTPEKKVAASAHRHRVGPPLRPVSITRLVSRRRVTGQAIAKHRDGFQGADLKVHAIPLADVRTVPASPMARNCVPDQVKPLSAFVVPEALAVHVVASGEVTIVPALPTATNWFPDQVTPFSVVVVPEVRVVQVIPSGDVRTMPPLPTVTNSAPDQVTP
jgi:hypothetical protein